VTLCDVSPEMLEEARSRWPGLRLVEADARSLPFADGEFDAAIATDLAPHLPDLVEGLRELARVVRPGGTVVFDTSNAAAWWVLAYPAYVNWRPRRLVRTMLGGGVLPEWQARVRHHRAGEAREAIRAAGLDLKRMQRFGPPWSAKWHLWWTEKA
jgi:ubiquinone/menaquinone biosynthesis C-methylase UbiE